MRALARGVFTARRLPVTVTRMDSASNAGRGVGPTVHTPLPPHALPPHAPLLRVRSARTAPARARMGLIALLLLVGTANPTAPSTAIALPVPTTPLTQSVSTASSGSDRIGALLREMRRVQARLEVTNAQVTVLTARRDEASAGLAAARAALARARTDLRAARAEVTSAKAANRSARKARKVALSERRSARTSSAAADAQLASIQTRLDALEQVADRSATRVRRKATRVERATPGTPDWQKAFVTWQIAAVQDRAAHARMVLVEDQAVDDFVAQQAAEASLTQAEFAAAEAKKARLRAKSAKDLAVDREATLTEARAATKVEAAAGRRALAVADTALEEAQALARKLTRQLADLGEQVAEYEDNLAGGAQ